MFKTIYEDRNGVLYAYEDEKEMSMGLLRMNLLRSNMMIHRDSDGKYRVAKCRLATANSIPAFDTWSELVLYMKTMYAKLGKTFHPLIEVRKGIKREMTSVNLDGQHTVTEMRFS